MVIEKKTRVFSELKLVKKNKLLDDVLFMGSRNGKIRSQTSTFRPRKVLPWFSREEKLSTGTQHATFISQGQCADACLDKNCWAYFHHLLSNAIKYSLKAVGLHNLFVKMERWAFKSRPRYWYSPEDLDLLFESFHRASNVKSIPGTGLGLDNR